MVDEENLQEEAEGVLETLQLAGRLIMENGGETYRVEETVCRMGKAFGLTSVESFAVPSGIFISDRTKDGKVQTGIQRVRRGGTHLQRVDEVNRISRRTEHEHLRWRQVQEELKEVEKSAPYPVPLQALASGVCAAGFCVMFQGGWQDALLAFLVSALVQWLSMLLSHLHLQSFVSLLLCGFLATFLSHGIARNVSGFQTEAIVAGILMPMLPGLAMTNAVQDTMRGDMISGLSHFAQAVLTAGLLAGGAIAGAYVIRLLPGGV